MELNIFLQQLFQQNELPSDGGSVIWFLCEGEYPSYFFSHVRSYISRHAHSLALISTGYTAHYAQEQVAISFLGSERIIFISPYASSVTERKKVLELLAEYTGPHRIICPILKSEVSLLSLKNYITIAENVSVTLIRTLALFFENESSSSLDHFLSRVMPFYNELPIETMLMMLNYQQVTGKNVDQFISTCLSKIIIPQPSLYLLSQAFFARDGRKLFQLWAKLGIQFVPQFWISYWSEQTWRATLYCSYMANNNRVEAKRVGYRLPFSFLNTDWRLHKSDHLLRVHQYICAIDNAGKRGSTFFPFEQMYAKFLLKDFENDSFLSSNVQVG